MKKVLYGLAILMMLSFLMLFPVDALAASRAGLALWFDTLLPTLLPFMILSNFLIRAGLIQFVVAVFHPLFGRILHLSKSGTYALVIGFLCGYPMGAKVLSDLRCTGAISREEAEYLLGFCNNISPSFIITFLVTTCLGDPKLLVPTLLILYGAPFIYALLLNPSYRKKIRVYPGFHSQQSVSHSALNFSLVDLCIMDGISTIVKLGGYVMLFAIISGMIRLIPISQPYIKAVLIAVTEITNGIPEILTVFDYPNSYLALMILCSFGALSSLAQTNSVIKSAHLSLWKYVRSKVTISIIAGILALCFIRAF